jgi:pyruvate/2-oxoglutarate dehydrogenase complex dihydrolipoamide dehydrogenase (E3) component
MVAGARQNYASRPAQDRLDLNEGEAHFSGPKTLEVALTDGGTRQISAPVIVIDAGTRPKPLAITGSGDVRVLDSTSIMELGRAPRAPDHPRQATSGRSSGRFSAGSAARSPSSKAPLA